MCFHRPLLSPCFCVLALVLAGCQAVTRIPKTPKDALTIGEELLAEKKPAEAIATLDYFGPDRLPGLDDKAKWYLLAGTARFQTGEAWDAYLLIRDFIREHRFLPLVPRLAKLTYQIGDQLAHSDGSFWIFYSDRQRGKTVLSDFVTVYSTNPHMPDALHRLGEIAYQDGRYELARERYTQIITGGYQNSVWNTKAVFRVAMCYFRRLEGPEYDLAEMEKAMVELTDFLKSDVENPKFRVEAQAALRTVHSWLAEKHESIASFYLQLGNVQGGRHHLNLARTQFPETAAAKRAGRRLMRLDRTAPSPAGEAADSGADKKEKGENR